MLICWGLALRAHRDILRRRLRSSRKYYTLQHVSAAVETKVAGMSSTRRCSKWALISIAVVTASMVQYETLQYRGAGVQIRASLFMSIANFTTIKTTAARNAAWISDPLQYIAISFISVSAGACSRGFAKALHLESRAHPALTSRIFC